METIIDGDRHRRQTELADNSESRSVGAGSRDDRRASTEQPPGRRKLYERCETEKHRGSKSHTTTRAGKETEQQTVATQVQMLWGARDSERVTQRKQTRNVACCSGEPVRPETMHQERGLRDAQVRGRVDALGCRETHFSTRTSPWRNTLYLHFTVADSMSLSVVQLHMHIGCPVSLSCLGGHI
jgi:hypothetical protein